MINAVCLWTGRFWWAVVLAAVAVIGFGFAADAARKIRDCAHDAPLLLPPPLGHPYLDFTLRPDEKSALDGIEAANSPEISKLRAILNGTKGGQA